MDPRMIPRGGSPEYNSGELEGKARSNEPGVYFHPQAQKFIETTGTKRPDGSMSYARDPGKIQGDAFTQIGYRQATKEEAGYHQAAKKAIETVQRIKRSSTTTVMSSTGRR
jgi:hypothetical protein